MQKNEMQLSSFKQCIKTQYEIKSSTVFLLVLI